MRCIVCELDQNKDEFDAHDAVVSVCRACITAMIQRRRDRCTACGGTSAVITGGKCVTCRTDARLNRGGNSNADNKQNTSQVAADGG